MYVLLYQGVRYWTPFGQLPEKQITEALRFACRNFSRESRADRQKVNCNAATTEYWSLRGSGAGMAL